MSLIGLRRVSTRDDKPRVTAELRLDPADSSKVIVVSGQGTTFVDDLFQEGVNVGGLSNVARIVGVEHGVFMPSGSDAKQVFRPTDGVQFLVAVIAAYGQSGSYSQIEPVLSES